MNETHQFEKFMSQNSHATYFAEKDDCKLIYLCHLSWLVFDFSSVAQNCLFLSDVLRLACQFLS
jgi:hypothetical protein